MGQGQTPQREFFPVALGGPLDEAQPPSRVGSGLTACENLVYRRFGAWGKRSGSSAVYAATEAGIAPTGLSSGIRWRAALPSPLTQLVVVAQGALYTGDDPSSGVLTRADNSWPGFANTSPVSFAPVHDPAYNQGVGADVLAMAGVGEGGLFGNGWIGFNGTLGATSISGTITVTVTYPSATPISVTYKILPTDNVISIAEAIVSLLNATMAVTPMLLAPQQPFLGQCVATSLTNNSGQTVGVVNLGALASGVLGITFSESSTSPVGYTVSVSGASLVTGRASGAALWDGTSVQGLGWQVQEMRCMEQEGFCGTSDSDAPSFFPAGCVAWHNHLWFWGDESSPGTVWATDIGTAEDMSFMIQNGGYPIGEGDGDPYVQALIPIGNSLFVFKSESIWVITGYDFQAGEYTFQLEPVITGFGIPATNCVTVLNNRLIFWSGTGFYRLAPGADEPEYIGAPIPITSGLIANGNQSLMRATSGSFVIESLLNNQYGPGPGAEQQTHTNVALFACDVGNGVADTVLVYDDDATQFIGTYAWAPWKGWSVTAWVPFTPGEDSAGTGFDVPSLYWIPPIPEGGFPSLNRYGSNATSDSGVAIDWLAQTGWVSFGTPALLKRLHGVFIEIEASAGATFALEVTGNEPGRYNNTQSKNYGPTVAPAGGECYQVPGKKMEPDIPGNAFVFTLSESSASTAYEITQLTLDAVVESFKP